MSEYRYLFSPLKIGSVVVPNRINFAAHLTNLSEDHQISEDHICYYRERASGGCGLITTEELTVHPSDLAYDKLVDAFDPKVIPGFKRLTTVVHEYDTRIFAQLNHNGMQADGKISRLPVWGPSAGRDPIFRECAKEMEIEDIRECIDYFAKSAGHVVEGGFDGIELQAFLDSQDWKYAPFCLKERMGQIEHFDPRKERSEEEIEKIRKACEPDCEVCKKAGK